MRPRTERTHQEHLDYLATHAVHTVLLGSSHFERFKTTGKDLIKDAGVAICGVGGDRIRHIRWRWENGLREATAGIQRLVIIAGGNDLTSGIPSDRAAKELHEFIQEVRKHTESNNVKLELVTIPIPRARDRKPTDATLFAAANSYAQAIHELGVPVIDLHAITLSCSATSRNNALFDDAVHLNRRGYQAFYKLLFPAPR